MYCPRCESEYQPGFVECAECGVALVEELPLLPPYVPLRLETVFAAGRPDLIAIAKSILISADVPFVVRGEHLQEMFAWGRFPNGYNVFIGPVQLLVAEEDAVDAHALLAHVGAEAPAIYSVEPPSGDLGSPSQMQYAARVLSRVIVFSCLLSWVLQLAIGLPSALWGLFTSG